MFVPFAISASVNYTLNTHTHLSQGIKDLNSDLSDYILYMQK